MPDVDVKAYVYLYSGAVAVLTTEMKLILASMLNKDTGGFFLMAHTTHTYLWSLAGASAITMALVWFTGIDTFSRQSVVLLTVFGLVGGLLTFHPRPKPVAVKTRVIPIKENEDGTVEIDMDHINQPDVRETLFGDEGREDEPGFLKRKAMSLMVGLLPPVKRQFNRIVDSAILQNKGYEIKRRVVIPAAEQAEIRKDIEKAKAGKDLFRLIDTEAVGYYTDMAVKRRLKPTKVDALGMMRVLQRVNEQQPIQKGELWGAIRYLFEVAIEKNKIHTSKTISKYKMKADTEAIKDIYKQMYPEDDESDIERFNGFLLELKGT